MERLSRFWISTKLIAAVLLLVAAAAPALKAEFECKQELMAGAWVVHAELEVLGIEGSPLQALAGPFSVVALVAFDELGRATTALQTNTTVVGVIREDFLAEDRPAGALNAQFTVNPDCTGRFIWTDRASGVTVFAFDTVCANRQQECWATWTQSFGNTSPPDFNGIVKLKRVDAETKVDAQTAAKIDAILFRLGVSRLQVREFSGK